MFGRQHLLRLRRGGLAGGAWLAFAKRGEGGEAGGGVEVEVVVHAGRGAEVRAGGREGFGGKWWWLPPIGGPGKRSRRARIRLVSAPTQIRLKIGPGMGRQADACTFGSAHWADFCVCVDPNKRRQTK